MSKNKTLRVGGILHNSLVNGEGIRTVIFLSGCDKSCRGCHNLHLQDFSYGKDMTVSEIVSEIKESLPLIDGITLSGGDPICQYSGVLELCKQLKLDGVNVWMYTGDTIEHIIKSGKSDLLRYIDVLVDGLFIDTLADENLKYKGSSNQRILHLDNGEVCECDKSEK